jgi:hypothetical protein
MRNTMIVCFTQDPTFNAVLREIVLPGGSPTNEGLGSHDFTESVSERQRLLRLVEAGIPSWAVFCTRYGIFYHRYLRVVVGWAVNLWPLMALFLGLYDLYSHMPHVHEYLVPFFSRFEEWWIFQIFFGIGVVFGYLVYVFNTLVFYASLFFFYVVEPLYPALALFYPLYSLVCVVVTSGFTFGAHLLQLVFGSVGTLLFGVLHAIVSPIVFVLSLAPTSASTTTAAASSLPQFMTQLVKFWSTVLRPVKNLVVAIYNNIIHAGSLIARHEASLRMWYMTKFRLLRNFVLGHVWKHWRRYSIAILIVLILVYGPVLIGYIFGVDES